MRRVVISALTAAVGVLMLAGPAHAYVNPADAAQAAAAGARWFQQTQNAAGALGAANGAVGGGDRFGEWSLTALAAGGVNAADATPTLFSSRRSAQDYYDEWWTERGPGAVSCPAGGDNPDICDQQPDGLPTDAARTVLSAIAGGLQPSRISADRDYVSRLAFWWSGDQVGYRDLLNDDIFTIIALAHAGAPKELLRTLAAKVRSQQLADGGWHWRASTPEKPIPTGVASDTDMTAAAIGALCAAGSSPTDDRQIRDGLGLIEERQSSARGGFSTSRSDTGTNTNTTAWVASAFSMCGIDPQSGRWTTDEGKTPLDFLVAMQNDNGSFRYMPSNPSGSANLMASYQAVSPLGGNDWTGDAPARENSGEPVVKPAPYVASGTVVPLTLVVDHGEGAPVAERARMCRVEVPEGSDLSDVLSTAEEGSAPGGCIGGVTTSRDGDAIEVDSANGGTGQWTVEVNGEGEGRSTDAAIGLGDMVVLRYRGEGSLNPPAIEPVPQIDTAKVPDPDPGPGQLTGTEETDSSDTDLRSDPIRSYARAKLVGKPKLKRGRVKAKVKCPASARRDGCAVMATFAVRLPAKKRFKAFGATAAEIRAGQKRVLTVEAGRKVRKILKRTARRGRKGRALIRVTVGTRSPDGVVRYARARGRVRGR